MSTWDDGPSVDWGDKPTEVAATWDEKPAAPAGKWDDDAISNANVGFTDGEATNGTFGGDAGDTNGAGGGDDACRNCGQAGHFARECTEPKKLTGECFRCGQIGHNKAGCTNDPVERPFQGICRVCEQEGHRAADCPQKPAEPCRACGVEGHKASECEANRKIDRSKIEEMDKGSAWQLIRKGVADKDMTDVKKAIESYIKADPSVTYPQLETRFRAQDVDIYCIAQELDIPQTMTAVDIQGKAECKYIIGYSFNPKPRRAVNAQGWPRNAEENLERLANAGVPMENYVPLCRNCNGKCHPPFSIPGVRKLTSSVVMGHLSKECPEEKITLPALNVVMCYNCGQSGHRIRDCEEERHVHAGKTMECRRCGEDGHMAKECPNGGGDRACHNCGSFDHISKECDQPKNPANMTCRNCDQVGHLSRECPEPKDWSRVKCPNCGQMGHGLKRCTEPIAEECDGGFGSGRGDGGFGGGGAVQTAAVVASDDWAPAADEPSTPVRW